MSANQFPEVCLFVLAKIFYLGYMLVFPAFFQPILHVLITFVAVHLVFGFTLSLVFQLAHTVEHNTFPTPEADTGMMAHEWAVHDVETTADFAPTNAPARIHWPFTPAVARQKPRKLYPSSED